MHPETQGAFAPGEALLAAVNQRNVDVLAKTNNDVVGAYQQAVGAIPQALQAQGIDFAGFTPAEYARYFGVEAEPALASLRGGLAENEMAQKGLLAQLSTTKGITGLEEGQKKSEREEDAQIKREGLSQEENLTYQEINAELEAARIRKAREEEERRKREAEQAAKARAYGQGSTGPQAFVRGNAGGSTQFGFTDANGAPISAAKYAQLTGQPLARVLGQMAQQGDSYAGAVLRQIGQDPFYSANAGRYKQAYSALYWGT